MQQVMTSHIQYTLSISQMGIKVNASFFPCTDYAAECYAHLALQLLIPTYAKTCTMWMQVSIMAAVRHPNVGTNAYAYVLFVTCLCDACVVLMHNAIHRRNAGSNANGPMFEPNWRGV